MYSFARWKKFQEETRKTNIQKRLRVKTPGKNSTQGKRKLQNYCEGSFLICKGRLRTKREDHNPAGGSLGMSTEACLKQGQKASKKGSVGGQRAPVGISRVDSSSASLPHL